MRHWLATCAAAALAALAPAWAKARVLDDFRDPALWQAVGSDQVSAAVRADPRGGLCVDYDFAGVSGYALLRRALPMDLPPDYSFELRMRGTGPRNDFEFKLIDAGGQNVWWHRLPEHAFRATGERLRIRKRQVAFAWGPAADRELRTFATIELAIAAGRSGGGRGSVCFERLELHERAATAPPGPPRMRVTDARTVEVDFGAAWEFNGLALRWRAGERPADYDVEATDDGRAWRTVRRVRGAAGDFDALYLPGSEARRLRIRSNRGGAAALADVAAPDGREWPDLNAVVMRRAAEAARGLYPRAWRGEQSYWTLLAPDGGGAHSALLSEDGALEAGRGGFSVEPFVRLPDGTLVSWADVRIEHRLRDGYLPVPSVRWTHPSFTLDIEAAAAGTRERSRAVARFVLRNASGTRGVLRLVLAVRPLQVNPPQQFLGLPGGVSAIRTVGCRGAALHVNGRAALRPSRLPDGIAAGGWDAGPAVARMGRWPAACDFDRRDPQGFASAALAWNLDLRAGEAGSLAIALPLAGGRVSAADAAEDRVAADLDRVAATWRARLNPVPLTLPAKVHDSLRTALAHILMSRDGPALQPGTRAYARSWIRDGAMMAAALLRLGEVAAAREFVDWFAPRIFASGKVPCCVDARGSDPVVENDSHGEYLYAVAEVWRHTGDARWLAGHWPKVASVARYMESLRQSERIAANREGERAAWWGLMPKSISHEGYSDRPVHSYWDDFWALRGFKDAVQIARALGREAEAAEFARWRDEFEAEFGASIRATAAAHRIDYVAGSAELGDFDATSTTIALDPAQAARILPPAMLDATFERYWRESQARARGERDWKDYTPYELRSVGALVRLGKPERAHAMLDFFFADQRPREWNQWAEVVVRDPRTARFLGDMPHAWVASDFIRSALDLLAYERDDRALVLGAGIPEAWLGGGGVAVRGMSTPYGPLTFAMRREGARIVVDVPDGNARPPGGLVLKLPGRDEVRIERLPARLEIEAR